VEEVAGVFGVHRIAYELFYRECPDAADRFQKAGL
jgi:hypothetical protein